ncbi:PEP-CTERM sorting domain-containing protein [Roseibacillus persicicus]|uniref:PEP-CTERM sorting domain-containing protein n=1 Tax=Roseibacillus persicicus TaxID=454148 RepID=UPI00167B013E|nr:PEP-CTERM sorting domain-containing protein [Roseibacillus persicicus]
MTQYSCEERQKSRKRWLPYLAGGIFGLHALLFFLLAQCSSFGTSTEQKVSYIDLKIEQNHRKVDLTLPEPPERMFYQYASFPLEKREEAPQPLSYPHWKGWETLVALRVEDSVPMENYRLTMSARRSDPPARSISFQPVFRSVIINGTVLQPVETVPEPSSAMLIACGLLGLVTRRSR